MSRAWITRSLARVSPSNEGSRDESRVTSITPRLFAIAAAVASAAASSSIASNASRATSLAVSARVRATSDTFRARFDPATAMCMVFVRGGGRGGRGEDERQERFAGAQVHGAGEMRRSAGAHHRAEPRDARALK